MVFSYTFSAFMDNTIVSSRGIGKSFIPVTLNEQTGKVINGNDIVTVLPYPIDLDKGYTIDLDTSLTMPQGFTYTIKNITKPSNGTLRRNSNILTYTPLGMKTSGKIKLTIELKNESHSLTGISTGASFLNPSPYCVHIEQHKLHL